VVAVAYAPVFRDLIAVWGGDSYASQGFLILLWSAWVAWSARGTITRAEWRLDPAALPVVAAGIALLAFAHARDNLTLAVLSLPVVLLGVGRGLLGGEAFRPLLFPITFLAFMAPLSPEMVTRVSLPLQQLAAGFADLVLAALGIPAGRDGLLIHLRPAVVHVSEACSGLRFLSVMVVLGVGYAWAVRRRLVVRVLVCALAVAAAIGANLVRVAGTVVLVDAYGAQAAEGTVHSLFGKAIYLVALGLFLFGAHRLRRPGTPR
jgi:exosortase